MPRILIFILFACCLCNAAFLDIDLKDSKLQTDSRVYDPGSIIGFAFEFGLFNEPDNMIDYTLAVGFSRFGYSHSDGDVSVSAWDIYIKPMVWSVTIRRIMFEVNAGYGYILSTNNFNPEITDVMENGFDNWDFMDQIIHKSVFKYGYRLGYRINDQLQVSLIANYQYFLCGWYGGSITNAHIFTGGWGFNLQWNIPWIPF